MSRPLEQSVYFSKLPGDEQREQERMIQIRLLLEHLLKNERTSVRMILDCLYDVGSVNLINQKVRHRSLNQLMRWIAGLSKPIFRVVALRWFYRNCPQRVTDWLYSKVSFEVAPPPEVQQLPDALPEAPPVLLIEAERHYQEVQQLQSQVRQLRRSQGLLIATIALLGGTTLWLGYERLPQQFIQFPSLESQGFPLKTGQD